QGRFVADLRHRGGGARSRGPVGAGRSRRPLSLRDTARAMSQENVEIVKAVYARWSKGDLRATLDVADPLILFVQPQSITFEAGAIMGIEELIDDMRRH